MQTMTALEGLVMHEKLKVNDIMTKDVASVSVPGNRDDILTILKERQVSGVPVVKEGDLVGIVTRSDLLKNPSEDQIAMLMTRNPISVMPDASIESAARLMVAYSIQRLPVVENNTLVGIITVRDLIKAIADMEIDESISKYMGSKVVAVWDETPLPIVGMIMELADVKACPVIDRDLQLVGMVRDKDLILRSVVEDAVHHSDISASSDEDEWTWESLRDTLKIYYSVSRIVLPDVPARDAMHKTPVVSENGTHVSDVARMMKREELEQLPVVTASEKLHGILHDNDLIKCLIA